MLKKLVYYIRDYLEKCVYFFRNDNEYRKQYRKQIKSLLFKSILTYLFLILLFIINRDSASFIKISVFFGLIWIVFTFFYALATIPFDRIKPNMDKLPNKIGKYRVLLEYNPPKWLNPSEVWMLYNQNFEFTNISCMIYKRENEWLIKIEHKNNWDLILYRNNEMDNNVPSYERNYWNMIWRHDSKDRVIWKPQQSESSKTSDLNTELLKYCIEKWRMYIGSVKISAIIRLLLVFFLFPPFWFIFVMVILDWCVRDYRKNGKITLQFNTAYRHKLHVTEEWEKLLSHIVGYKYWLEHCEENQIKKILKEDQSFNSKTLPYVVALRMDWKLLDKKFYK